MGFQFRPCFYLNHINDLKIISFLIALHRPYFYFNSINDLKPISFLVALHRPYFYFNCINGFASLIKTLKLKKTK